jgi:hypothetical protein
VRRVGPPVRPRCPLPCAPYHDLHIRRPSSSTHTAYKRPPRGSRAQPFLPPRATPPSARKPPPAIPPVRSRLVPTQPAVPWTDPGHALPCITPPLAGMQATTATVRVRRRGPSSVLLPPRPSEETKPRPPLGQPPPAPGQPRPPASPELHRPHRPPRPRTQLRGLESFGGSKCEPRAYL